jgi:hypothetical protein
MICYQVSTRSVSLCLYAYMLIIDDWSWKSHVHVDSTEDIVQATINIVLEANKLQNTFRKDSPLNHHGILSHDQGDLYIERSRQYRASILRKNIIQFPEALSVVKANDEKYLQLRMLLSNRSSAADVLMLIEKYLAAFQHRDDDGCVDGDNNIKVNLVNPNHKIALASQSNSPLVSTQIWRVAVGPAIVAYRSLSN